MEWIQILLWSSLHLRAVDWGARSEIFHLPKLTSQVGLYCPDHQMIEKDRASDYRPGEPHRILSLPHWKTALELLLEGA